MEKRKIGSLEVSLVGLGCNNFGRRLDAAATERVLDAAIDAGINFFDTADIYGGTLSETFMGEAMKGRWSQVILATKFGAAIDPEHKGAKPEYVKQAAEASLRRLQIDCIDLYQLHVPDPEVPIAETLGALNDLVKEGKVREIGCSNFSVEQLRDAAESVSTGAARFVSVQNHYSLFHREPELGVLDECANENLALLPYFPLASGLLSGKYRKGQPLPEGTRIQAGSDWLTEEKLDKVEALISFAESRGRSLLELATSWLASEPTVASVISGATSPAQVSANAAAAGWKMSAEERSQIRRLVEGGS